METLSINKLIENPIIQGIGLKNTLPSKVLTEQQKIAIAKAVLYIISADGVITDEEKQFFSQLCADMKADNNIMEKALALSDEAMFNALKTVTDEQEGYILSCLNNAANADNELVEEESKLIDDFVTHFQTGEKPKDFYTKILTF